MAVYLVTWNINKAGSLYTSARDKFLSGFNGLDVTYAGETLDTVVFVSTTLPINTLYDRLVKNLDENDRLMLNQVFKNCYAGFLDVKVISWLNARLV